MVKEPEQCKQDGDYFRAQLGVDKGFLITYDLYTEESVSEGESEDGGYDSYESCEPDEFDDSDVTAVSKAIHFLTREHCTVASSSHFHEGVSYTDADNDIDYRSGDETQHSYHPKNFTVEEQRDIFNAVR